MDRQKKKFQWFVRGVILFLAALLLFSGPIPWLGKELIPSWGAGIFPKLSPLVVIKSILASREWYLGWFWSVPGLMVLFLGVLRGRWFCRWLCPLGTVYRLTSRYSLKKNLLRIRLNGYLFWIIMFSALVGTPLLLFLDPLSKLGRLAWLVKGTFTFTSLLLAGVFLLFLILAVIQPMLWCSHFCPLGYFFDLASRKGKSYGDKFKRDRRKILAGMAIGVPVGLIFSKISGLDKTITIEPILPPGSETPDDFAALCLRCYACVHVCPTQVLTVEFPERKPLQWFAPELDTSEKFCDEDCNRCCQVCPSGAIQHLTLAEKSSCQIGIARVNKRNCRSWGKGEYCMICQSVCPYEAIDAAVSVERIICPKVVYARCRGCGRCQNECPEREEGAAIQVVGVSRQRFLAAD